MGENQESIRLLHTIRNMLIGIGLMVSALGPEAGPYLERRGPKYHVDLAGLNRQWLLHAGVAPEHIDICGLCTACRPDLFWSHRKMGEARGAQVAVICL